MSDFDPDHMADALRMIERFDPAVLRSDSEMMRLPLNAVVIDATGAPWVLLGYQHDGVARRSFYPVFGPDRQPIRPMMLGPVVHLHGFWERDGEGQR